MNSRPSEPAPPRPEPIESLKGAAVGGDASEPRTREGRPLAEWLALVSVIAFLMSTCALLGMQRHLKHALLPYISTTDFIRLSIPWFAPIVGYLLWNAMFPFLQHIGSGTAPAALATHLSLWRTFLRSFAPVAWFGAVGLTIVQI